MKYISCVLGLAVLLCSACKKQAPVEVVDNSTSSSPIQLRQIAWADLPDWRMDSLTHVFRAYKQSFAKLSGHPWDGLARAAKHVDGTSEVAIRSYFEAHFTPHHVFTRDGLSEGTITGYYEPLLHGSRQRTAKFKYPLYGRPKDLITFQLKDLYPELKGVDLRGRLVGQNVLPFATRAQIDGPGLPLKGSEVFWVDNRVDLYFLQVQGSGRIKLGNGQIVMVGFDGSNGHPYTSVGKRLAAMGAIPAEQLSMPSIKAWFEANPERFDEVVNQNARYPFFREMEAGLSGPLGSLNVALTAERSIAVDRRFIELGTPVFMSTRYPDSGKPFNKLMIAQDTGAAIKGRIRADIFWGHGVDAERRAGLMNERGEIWVLLPRSIIP